MFMLHKGKYHKFIHSASPSELQNDNKDLGNQFSPWRAVMP